GLSTERDESSIMRSELAASESVLVLCEHNNGTALGRFVRQRRELRCVGKFLVSDAGRRNKPRRLSISQGDRAGLVQQQGIYVSGCFDRATRHCQDVVLNQAVHSRNADRRKQSSNGCRD